MDAGGELCTVIFSITSFSCVTTAGSSVTGMKTRGGTREQNFLSLLCFETILKHYIVICVMKSMTGSRAD